MNYSTFAFDDQVLKKDVLSQEEIQKLMDTHYQFEKENVRNAFIFCLYTGMRFCDVKDLRYSNIDYANKLLSNSKDIVQTLISMASRRHLVK